MAWIESHQELARHPKTKRFARQLGISIPEAVGHLHLLWWWALDFAQDGDISMYDDDDIADACMWEGDKSTLVNALSDAGFIDDGCIHDWHDYAGKIAERKTKDRERKKQSSQNSNGIPQTSAGIPKHSDGIPTEENGIPNTSDGIPSASDGIPRNSAPTVPNLTIPNQTKPNQTKRWGFAPCSAIVEDYNATCTKLPSVKELTDKRRTAIKARWQEHQDVGVFHDAFERVNASSFLCGVNDRKWSATFDWILKPDNFAKILEGNYSDKQDGSFQTDEFFQLALERGKKK